MQFIPYGHQHISDIDIARVVKALKSPYLTQGPSIAQFEQKLAAAVGARYAVVVNSGTAALHTAYFALGLSSDDEFITSPMTFAATANAGLYLGAKPVFVDVEPETGNIDTSRIESAITPQTRLLSVVHYAGHSVDMRSMALIAKKHKLKVVEDACHALGGFYQDRPIGSCQYSDVAVFSFHPVKHITTGEGGALVTNDPEVYQRALLFRTHGITKDPRRMQRPNEGTWYYEMQALGYNYRLTDFQAILGLSQLRQLNRSIKARKKLARYYEQAWQNNPYFSLPPERNQVSHAFHLYPIRLSSSLVPHKKDIVQELHRRHIGVQVHYVPVYLHPYYQQLGYEPGLCPTAESFYQQVLSMPMYPSLSISEQKYVTKVMIQVCQKFSPQ